MDFILFKKEIYSVYDIMMFYFYIDVRNKYIFIIIII